MASLALAFDILARDKGASKTFKNVGDAAETAGKKGGGFGSAMKKGLGIAAGAVAAAGIGSFFADTIGKASDLSETINKSNVIFGKNADEINKWSKTAARSFGLSREAALEAASGLGNMLTQLGYTADAATDASTETVKLAADLGSFNNLGTEDVLDRIGAAMRGEYDSLQLLIPNINAARVQQEALAATGKDAASALTAQEKAAATLAIIQRDGAAATDDFAETQDGLANSSKIARAQFDDLKASIGEQLLPVMTDLMGFVNDTALPAISSLVAGLESGEGAGGKVAAVFGAVQDAGKAVAEYWNGTLVPAARDVAKWFRADVQPILVRIGAFLKETFTPAFETLVRVYNEDVKPAVDQIRDAFKENQPAIEQVTKAVGMLVGGFLAMELKVRGTILPVLIQFAGFMAGRVADAVSWVFDRVSDLTGAVSTVSGWFSTAMTSIRKFTDALDDYKLPGWVSTLAKVVGGIAGNLGSAAGRVAAFFGQGDGPGRYAGGNTLNKVKGILPAGAQITSTYRTPAQNRAVGGVVGSYHTDRGNPAVDIAGSRAVMDQVYARLAAMGGHRELLYKVAGHWDHVHVAHEGGTVAASWPTMPGWRSDERPVRAKIGETITPAGQSPKVELPPIYVENPFTGEYLLARVSTVAQREATSAVRGSRERGRR